MTRRLWIAVGVVAFLVVIVFVGHVLLSVKAPLWSINRERFDRVEEGMTRDEVIAILGPPGDRTTFKTKLPLKLGRSGMRRLGFTPEEWVSDRGHIVIWFEGDKVVGPDFRDPAEMDPRPIDEALL